MRIHRTHIKNFGCIKDLELDLDSLGPGIICIAGDTAAGKTHLLEALMPAVLSLRSPSYGEWIKDHFVGTGRIETTFSANGNLYQSTIEGSRGKTPNAILRQWSGDTSTQIAGPSVREYYTVIEKRVGSNDVILNTLFAAQGDARGLFGRDQEYRRRLFTQFLGIENLDRKMQLCATELKSHKDAMKVANFEERKKELQSRIESSSADIQRLTIEREALEANIARHTAKRQFISGRLLAVGSTHASLRSRHDAALAEAGTLLAEKKEVEMRLATAILRDITMSPKSIRDQLTEVAHQMAYLSAQRMVLSETLKQQRGNLSTVTERDRVLDLAVETHTSIGEPGARQTRDVCVSCPLYQEWAHLKSPGDRQDLAVSITETEVNIAENQLQLELLQKQQQQLKHDLEYAETVIAARQNRDADLERVAELEKRINDLHESAFQALSSIRSDHEEKLKAAAAALSEIAKRMKDQLLSITADFGRASGIQEQARTDLGNLLLEETRFAKMVSDGIFYNHILGFLKDRRADYLSHIVPDVARITGELLGMYDDGRYAIELKPWTDKKDGGLKDTFTPVIVDRKLGIDREKGSEGETAILGEALRVAMSVAMANTYGNFGGTLCRDEVTSGLSAGVASVYMSMIRRAIELGQFHQVVMIAHYEHIWQQGDTIVHMNNGQITNIERNK